MSNEQYKNLDPLTAAKLEKVRESMVETHALLVTDNKKAILPESIFKDHFLPYFSGETSITKETPVIAEWVGVAGSAMSEVDVIDPQGNVVFTVPALLDTNMLEIANRKEGNSLADIFSKYDLHNNNISTVANNYLHSALDNKAGEIVTGDKAQTNTQQRWQNIMAYYGKGDAVGGVKQITAEQGGGLVYD